jgi:hypothetical protein
MRLSGRLVVSTHNLTPEPNAITAIEKADELRLLL